jgi:Interleukin-like EMT inducer
MSQNGIAHLSTKELRQKAKLDLAASDRAARSNARSTYDLTELPTQYANNSIANNPNGSGLIHGRPWINTTSFTFYEAFGTTSALETTRYNVTGNKIYVYSSTFDVPSYQNARVVVNDIEVLNVGLRGHNMVVLNSYGDVVSTARYDTYGVAGDSTALASALSAVASGNIVVLAVWDASALTAGVRSALNTGYGSTNNNTWTASRVDHIFIGIKI